MISQVTLTGARRGVVLSLGCNLSLSPGSNEQPFLHQIVQQPRQRAGLRLPAPPCSGTRMPRTRRAPVNGGGTRLSPERTNVSVVERVS